MIQTTYATLDAPPISGAMQACSYLLRKHAPLYLRIGDFGSRVVALGRKGRAIPESVKAKAREMLAGGLSTGQIGLALNISTQSVRNIKKEAKRGTKDARPIPTHTPSGQNVLKRKETAQEGVLA
jgi:hypothetical protein